MRRLVIVFLALSLPLTAWARQDVTNTVHNLSVSGPGTFKSLAITEVCVFCHTPHHANPSVPLWNHRLSEAQTYIDYTSSTFQGQPGQPTGSSLLCLSCHDGTVALGALGNPRSANVNDMASTFLTGRANLSTDLTDDHPISFRYDGALQVQNRQLAHPATIDLPLESDELQCASCHDPHEKDILPFLRRTSLYGQICVTCHALGDTTWTWSASAHATSSARAGIGGADPWAERKPEWRGATVAENACFGCHTPHTAAMPERLIKDREEATCLRCHGGGVAQKDIRSELLVKPSAHRADLRFGLHDPAEDFAGDRPPDHVECVDCHNPHASAASTAVAPFVSGSLTGVAGITASGAQVAAARFQYEICYKCHGDNTVVSAPEVPRVIDETNTRLEFDTASASYHPVEGPGRNPTVPSLVPSLTVGSIIYCTDCHNNNDAVPGGGAAPNGPHASLYRPLLERNYSTADRTPESPQSYALCYKCHNRTSILNDDSFKGHAQHITSVRAPCSVCHDPHGISAARGNSVNNAHLINFDRTIVFANRFGEPLFTDTGFLRGTCDLVCHNERHDNASYP